MRGDAIKTIAVKLSGKTPPTDDEVVLAIAESVDIALDFFANVARIAEDFHKLANPFQVLDGDTGLRAL